jgi:hypothetical protein
LADIDSQRPLIFQPPLVLLCSLAGSAFYAFYMLRSPGIRATMFVPSGPFLYVVPIVVPFLAFLFDRTERFRQSTFIQYLADIVVVGMAMGRVLGNIPFVSGHTLFLTYALLTSHSLVVRITAALVMLQTIYLKYFVWHDFVTSTNGIVLGAFAAAVVSKFGTKSIKPPALLREERLDK